MLKILEDLHPFCLRCWAVNERSAREEVEPVKQTRASQPASQPANKQTNNKRMPIRRQKNTNKHQMPANKIDTMKYTNRQTTINCCPHPQNYRPAGKLISKRTNTRKQQMPVNIQIIKKARRQIHIHIHIHIHNNNNNNNNNTRLLINKTFKMTNLFVLIA